MLDLSDQDLESGIYDVYDEGPAWLGIEEASKFIQEIEQFIIHKWEDSYYLLRTQYELSNEQIIKFLLFQA